MPLRWDPREHLSALSFFVRWLVLAGALVGVMTGSAVALFLWLLNLAIITFWNHPHLLFVLPFGGVAVSLLYQLFGKSAEAGNNLILDEIHEPRAGVPGRMAPLVLLGTVVTHLCGGSAGREGTAVQMGGSLASKAAQWLNLNTRETRMMLTAGIAAGMGSVFGTPLAGAIFSIEVLAIGRLDFHAIVPCLIASIVADFVTGAWGIEHQRYYIRSFSSLSLVKAPHLSLLMLGKVSSASVAFGLAAFLFAELAHGLQRFYRWLIPWPVLRPAAGASILIALTYLVGWDYLSLGVVANPHHPDQVSILSAFHPGGATDWSWWWKTAFTTVTVSSGFKGGEVTPLFYIGATLGNAAARLLRAPTDLFAGLGFVAVFAGATNTPLACTVMGIELFAASGSGLLDSGFVPYTAMACYGAYLFSGHSGIYLSQRVVIPKVIVPHMPPDVPLRRVRELHPSFGTSFLGAILSPAGQETEAPTGKGSPAPFSGSKELIASETRTVEPPGEIGASIGGHQMTSSEIGQIEIYFALEENRDSEEGSALSSKPTYQEIIDAARSEGIFNALVRSSEYAFAPTGKIKPPSSASSSHTRMLCIELIGHREKLEQFCAAYHDLLKKKVIVYAQLEQWQLT
jgi:H+/Cl- antiporter ClcA